MNQEIVHCPNCMTLPEIGQKCDGSKDFCPCHNTLGVQVGEKTGVRDRMGGL